MIQERLQLAWVVLPLMSVNVSLVSLTAALDYRKNATTKCYDTNSYASCARRLLQAAHKF
jgi:hypothetical protein